MSGIVHELKTDTDVFNDTWEGRKTFEIRQNDRGYMVDDILMLRETVHSGAQMRRGAPLEYTGRECTVRVTHTLEGYGLKAGWIIMSHNPNR